MKNENMPPEGNDSDKLETESALRGAACCVSYSSLPLKSDETFDTREFTYKFPDGRKVTTAIAKDGSDQGMWFRITKPLEKSIESELKFRLSLEAAAVLAQLIDYALAYPHNANSPDAGEKGKPMNNCTEPNRASCPRLCADSRRVTQVYDD
jgi:hypothetical protein